ncbi:MAG TPA: MqnA/MqnD/SBP family protein [Terriglobia bacterium]|nr:MqnA/MqnD/SBP family protein [Terriglobia bacterium]
MLELKLAHSPDSDDAFMFYALATNKVRGDGVRFTHALEDIQSLNEKAREAIYDITAISFHAYAYLAETYVLLPSGASFGDGYGPIVVGHGSETLRGKRVAVPGKMTTAYLALMLYESNIEPLVVPFDEIIPTVASGAADAGVVIHEGQLTYSLEGLNKIVDLGEWWQGETGLPLPLGGNAIKRALGRRVIRQSARLLKESIQYGLDHREEALLYAMQFSRGLDSSTADRFIAMYVNDWTLDYGERGRQAVQLLLDRGFESGVLPKRVEAEFAD